MEFKDRPKLPAGMRMKIPRSFNQRKEWFSALPENKKRVAVAQDAISQIEAKKYVIGSEKYFEVIADSEGAMAKRRKYENDEEGDLPLINLIQTKGLQCEVCARGGIFASMCRMDGQATNTESGYALEDFDSQEEKTSAKLFPYFAILEAMFERWGITRGDLNGIPIWITSVDPSTITDQQIEAIRKWVDNTRDLPDEERMILLMENIIRNDGDMVVYGVNMKNPNTK